MFCIKCGASVDADSGFCPRCGTSQKVAVPDKKKKILFFGAIGGACLIVALVLLLVLGGNSGFSSAEDAAEAFVAAKITHDGKSYVNCLHDFYIRKLGVAFGKDQELSRKEAAELMQYSLDKKPAADCKILSLQIVEYAQDSDYEYIRARKGYFQYLTDNEYAAIGSIAKVSVIYMSNGAEHTVNVTCLEMGGRWYVYP